MSVLKCFIVYLCYRCHLPCMKRRKHSKRCSGNAGSDIRHYFGHGVKTTPLLTSNSQPLPHRDVPPPSPQPQRQPVHSAQCDPDDLSVVRSNEDVQRWVRANLGRCPDIAVAEDKLKAALNSHNTLSSAFSGIGGETIALNILVANLKRSGGPDAVSHPIHLAAIDRDGECQTELRVLPHGPRRVYGPIESFASPELKRRLQMESAPFDMDRLMVMCTTTGAVQTFAPCVTHGGPCEHPRCHGHQSGTPCNLSTGHYSLSQCVSNLDSGIWMLPFDLPLPQVWATMPPQYIMRISSVLTTVHGVRAEACMELRPSPWLSG